MHTLDRLVRHGTPSCPPSYRGAGARAAGGALQPAGRVLFGDGHRWRAALGRLPRAHRAVQQGAAGGSCACALAATWCMLELGFWWSLLVLVAAEVAGAPRVVEACCTLPCALLPSPSLLPHCSFPCPTPPGCAAGGHLPVLAAVVALGSGHPEEHRCAPPAQVGRYCCVGRLTGCLRALPMCMLPRSWHRLLFSMHAAGVVPALARCPTAPYPGQAPSWSPTQLQERRLVAHAGAGGGHHGPPPPLLLHR